VSCQAKPLVAAGFTDQPRLTGLGNHVPAVFGGELPQDIWMHGVLLAESISLAGIELAFRSGSARVERPLAKAGRESPGYRLWPPLRVLPACCRPRWLGRGSC
jgi:hypothetical protein